MNFASLWWSFALLIIGAYLLGSVNNAIIYSRILGKDIRKLGSGNPGTMNVSRTLGLKAAVLILALDICKGVIPTLIASLAFSDEVFEFSTLPVREMAKYMAGFFVVLGHIFPCYYKFKGGKGIATTIGVFLVCDTFVAVIFAIVALLFILSTGIGSMGSFLATTPPAIFASLRIYTDYLEQEPVMEYRIIYLVFVNAFILGIVALTWIAHRQNIKRLLSGDEHPTEWLQMIKDIKLKKKLKRQREEADASNDSLGQTKNDAFTETATTGSANSNASTLEQNSEKTDL